MNHWERYVAVFCGGALGALARWGLVSVLPSPEAGFPWGTFAVNVTGAFGLSMFAVVVLERAARSTHLRPLVAVGFFGSYTTFSLMALDGLQRIEQDLVATAAVYWLATFVVGQLAATGGMWVGSRRSGARP